MKTAFGAIAGAAAVGAMLMSYNLGQRQALSAASMPSTQMVVGPDGIARPFLVQAGQFAAGQPLATQSYGWMPYSTMTPGAVVPNAYQPQSAYQPQAAAPVRTQYVTERVVTQPARRVSSPRATSEAKPRRSWQKSALLIGGSAGAGAGLGALMGGKKGALAGAAIGGGGAAIYDQLKRH
jgi:hypothetical protein